jgi:hypothetical protein
VTRQELERHAARMRLGNLQRREQEIRKHPHPEKRPELFRELYAQAQADYLLLTPTTCTAVRDFPSRVQVCADCRDEGPCPFVDTERDGAPICRWCYERWKDDPT